MYFEGFIQLLRYIRDNKNLGLRYYAKIEDSLIYDLFRQAIIDTDNQLMVFSDYIWQDYPDTGRSTGGYILFYQGGTMDNCTHVTGPVAQPSSEISTMQHALQE